MGIQAIFDKTFIKPIAPWEVPRYYLTPLRVIPPISAIGVTYIIFDALIDLDIHIVLKIIIHVITAFLSARFTQNIYLKVHGYSSDSAQHVLFSLIFGYGLLIAWYFFK